jgi:hypothetical protein
VLQALSRIQSEGWASAGGNESCSGLGGQRPMGIPRRRSKPRDELTGTSTAAALPLSFHPESDPSAGKVAQSPSGVRLSLHLRVVVIRSSWSWRTSRQAMAMAMADVVVNLVLEKAGSTAGDPGAR